MNNHDELRELLPLAAAGALNEEDAAAVRRHTAECLACGEELKKFQELAPLLANLPLPAVPPWLAQRTLQRVKERREAAEERRWHNRVLAFLVAFSWVMSLASWPVVRLAAGIGLLQWLAISMLLSWVTAGSAAVILGSHPSMRGRRI